MRSVREAAGRHLGIQAPTTVRSVAGELAVPAGSTLDLMARLDQQLVVRASPSLLPASVKGTAQLELTSDGFCSLRGHVHENGFLPHKWALVAAPQFADADGHGFAFTDSGKVTNSRDSDIDQAGWDSRISANWDQLKDAPVHFRLEVDVAVVDVVGAVLKALVGIAPIVLFVLFVSGSGPVRRVENPDGSISYQREFGSGSKP